ncbi:MAG: hypothetical protein HGB12_08600 [Bacteroidetes bacterium]|nr:hypothetical protein [Bacteroidota bacterium]
MKNEIKQDIELSIENWTKPEINLLSVKDETLSINGYSEDGDFWKMYTGS